MTSNRERCLGKKSLKERYRYILYTWREREREREWTLWNRTKQIFVLGRKENHGEVGEWRI